ncbi:MAG: Arc family DNA-binding protein [Aerococcus urinaeequi]
MSVPVKSFNLRMPGKLKARMENHAEKTFINQNSFILQAVQEKLDRENAEDVEHKEEVAAE